jgi:hypothetical protein
MVELPEYTGEINVEEKTVYTGEIILKEPTQNVTVEKKVVNKTEELTQEELDEVVKTVEKEVAAVVAKKEVVKEETVVEKKVVLSNETTAVIHEAVAKEAEAHKPEIDAKIEEVINE